MVTPPALRPHRFLQRPAEVLDHAVALRLADVGPRDRHPSRFTSLIHASPMYCGPSRSESSTPGRRPCRSGPATAELGRVPADDLVYVMVDGGEEPAPAEALFFDEVVGQLERERSLALFGVAPAHEPPGAVLEETPLPALQFVRRHLALARHCVERLAAEEPQDQLHLPLDAPTLRELRPLRREALHCQESWLWT